MVEITTYITLGSYKKLYPLLVGTYLFSFLEIKYKGKLRLIDHLKTVIYLIKKTRGYNRIGVVFVIIILYIISQSLVIM